MLNENSKKLLKYIILERAYKLHFWQFEEMEYLIEIAKKNNLEDIIDELKEIL